MPEPGIDWYLTRRARCLNRQPLASRDSDYVLCWLQQTLRGEKNPVIDAAIAFGRATGKPVVVYHGLGQRYPHASDRLHRFILEASRALERDVSARGLRFLRHVDTDDNTEKGLLYRLASRAALVVLDDQSAFVGRWQAETVARRLDRLVVAVDAARLVPETALAGEFATTPAFRARHTQLRDRWLNEPSDLDSDQPILGGDLAVATTHLRMPGHGGITDLIERCSIDHTVPAVDWCNGDRASTLAHLAWAVETCIAGYGATRNNPALASTSYLSPYLHLGVIGPGEVAAMVMDSDAPARDQWKFLDEQLTWREYFHHRACHTTDPTAYSNLPEHARRSLANHAADPRETLYELDALIHGETDDAIWNVAQRQFLVDGWMHNNLRMYWGKRLIGWTRTPEIAWETACYLNDRFSLDGRDPATYGNLQWCFGASRPGRDAPVYGTVPQKSDRALRARSGFTTWVDDQLHREIPRVAVPEAVTPVAQPGA